MRYTQGWWGNIRKGDNLEDLRRIWEVNIEMDHKDVGWEGVVN
jgi:hypothetical protein